ncbi:unnamed protein product [Lactuca virosa]|uniref:CASP-like protein n=1 Tax=Lactuca virosa TaxID=75947 RepID=A0AAU9PUF0_9ASTR|nr:unnamed protein product [Lactuca virosa]
MKKKKLPQIRDLNNRNFCASSFKLFHSLFCFISRYSFLEFLRKSFNKLFASLSARLVKALTTLIIAILALLGTSSITTSNSVFSSTATGALASAPGAATTAAGAKEAAVTQSLSWRYSTSFCASARVRFEISSPSSTTFPSATAATGRRNVNRWESLGVRRGNSRVCLGEKTAGDAA